MLQISGTSHIGNVRTRNEDCMAIGAWCSDQGETSRHTRTESVHRPVLLAVADGMGGHQGGDVASRVVIERLAGMPLSEAFEQELEAAINAAGSDLQRRMREQPELFGMGSTIAGAVAHGERAFYFNIGDSRVYHLSNGRLNQLSHDDRAPTTNALTQAIGGFAWSEPQLDLHGGFAPIGPGDALLICSDGLTDLVNDEEIGGQLQNEPDEAAANLVSLALERGARDNVSVVVARVLPA